MSPDKSTDELMYDAITDLFRVVQGQPSMTKLEQIKRTATNFSKALDKVAEKGCIAVFERLQARVHKAFTAIEVDLTNIEVRVNGKELAVDKKIAEFEVQITSAKKLVDALGKELKNLERMFKGIGQ